MIYRNPSYGNDHNLTGPTSGPFASAPYALVGRFVGSGIPATPVGPRIICTARHAAPTVGNQFLYQGTVYTVQEVILAPSGNDIAFGIVDGTMPGAPLLYRGEVWSTANLVFVVGGGLGRGAPIFEDGELVGYSIGDFSTFAWRWGGNNPSFVTLNPPAGTLPNMGCKFDEGTAESCFCAAGDSGGGIFINSGPGGAWRYMGPAVSVTSGSQALFYTPENNYHGFIGALLIWDLPFIDAINSNPPEPIPQPPPEPRPPTEYPQPPARPNPEALAPIRGDVFAYPSFPGDALPPGLAVTSGAMSVEVADGQLHVSGGTGQFDTNRIERIDCYTADENWLWEAEILAPTFPEISAPSGAFLGIQTQASGVPSSVWGGIGLNAVGNGAMQIYAPGSSKVVAHSSDALGLVGSGNQLRLTLARSRGVVTWTVLNRSTQRLATISFRYLERANSSNGTPTVYPPSTGRPAIGTSGGSWSIKSLRFASNTRKYPPVVVIGDDIACGLTRGLYGVGLAKRWADVLQDAFGAPVVVYAGGGDTASMGQLRLAEVLSIEPQLAVVSFGLNDVWGFNIAPADIVTKLQVIVTALEAQQIECHVLTGLPNAFPVASNAEKMSQLREAILAAFPVHSIDTYPLFNDGAGGLQFTDDKIHPNAEGHLRLGRFVAGSL